MYACPPPRRGMVHIGSTYMGRELISRADLVPTYLSLHTRAFPRLTDEFLGVGYETQMRSISWPVDYLRRVLGAAPVV